eukprot:167128-Chlamydomonas_euryale.AAC.2
MRSRALQLLAQRALQACAGRGGPFAAGTDKLHCKRFCRGKLLPGQTSAGANFASAGPNQ